jgi:hypothetical protein
LRHKSKKLNKISWLNRQARRALFFGTIGSAFGVAPVFLANAVMLAAGGVIRRRR